MMEERGYAVETKQFSVPALATSSEALDLSNVLNAMKGVASISTDLATRLITVEYDPAYTSMRTLAHGIECSGYPNGRALQ